MKHYWLGAFLLLLVSACSTVASARTDHKPAFTVTPLLKTELTGDTSKQVLVGRAKFEPGASTGRHTHPGDEYATVVQGELTLYVEGREARKVMAGEAYHSPRGIVHETVNTGNMPAEVISTFVIDKNQALIIPAPHDHH